MSSLNPKVSVVVLNWNGKRFIDPFMHSFESLAYPKEALELLFVDNGSSDDSIEYLKSKYPNAARLKIIENGKNYGYAGGNNRGLHHASGDYVLICNNDLEFDKNLLAELISTAKASSADVVVPKLMYLNQPGVINNAGSRLDTQSDWPVYEIGKDEKDTGQYDEPREISALCGACMLIRRDFLQTVGMFDSKFFMYFEDTDLSWRGQNAGKLFYYSPKAVAYHFHTGSSKEGSKLFNHYVGRNRLLILTKQASFKVIMKAWLKTLRDHGLLRIKHILAALRGKYPKKKAISEFGVSQKMVFSAIALTPYALLKRWKILKEETL